MEHLIATQEKFISIYKTSVTKKSEIKLLTPFLNVLGEWNFDMDDCDNVLRIESKFSITGQAISLLAKYGFTCEEL